MSNYLSKTEVLISSEYSWKKIIRKRGVIWFKGYIHNCKTRQLADMVFYKNKHNIKSWLNSLHGHFSIIVKTSTYCFAAVDKVRSSPIIWAINKKNIILSDLAYKIEERLNLGQKDIDYDIVKAFAVSGYSVGEHTIYKRVKQINPGNFIWISFSDIKIENYYFWKPWCKKKNNSFSTKELNNVNENIIKKLIKSLDGRQAVIPLSAGIDSRFIASGLKHFKYDNVLCVSYGIKNNRDAFIAEKVAKKLGFNWIFIEYTSKMFKEVFYSDDYKKYMSYSDSLTSIHFVGEYLMMLNLRNNKLVKKDAIFINGQSGDFITGNHIPDELISVLVLSKQEREDIILNQYINKHYNHWKTLNSEENLKKIKIILKKQIKKIGGLPVNQSQDFGIYEYLEFIDRQAKYVINGQRTYEYFGYEWRLPLWDDEYLKFWEKVDLKDKKHQSLYRRTLNEYNWGNVWKDLEVNPIKINPKWIIPIRAILKIFFLLLGKKKWYLFERKYLDYFMTVTCAYGPWSYFEIVTDKRGFHNPIGWFIEVYLNKRNLNWKGEKI